jgi:hypothetical protein
VVPSSEPTMISSVQQLGPSLPFTNAPLLSPLVIRSRFRHPLSKCPSALLLLSFSASPFLHSSALLHWNIFLFPSVPLCVAPCIHPYGPPCGLLHNLMLHKWECVVPTWQYETREGERGRAPHSAAHGPHVGAGEPHSRRVPRWRFERGEKNIECL